MRIRAAAYITYDRRSDVIEVTTHNLKGEELEFVRSLTITRAVPVIGWEYSHRVELEVSGYALIDCLADVELTPDDQKGASNPGRRRGEVFSGFERSPLFD